MKNWKNALIGSEASILDAIAIIDKASLQIALVTSPEGKLLGVVTDGDVRRSLLKGVPLDGPVSKVMNTRPRVVGIDASLDEVAHLMKRKDLHQIPVVDGGGRVVGLRRMEDMVSAGDRDNWVVLMAGGLGTRLRPLTDDCPKPMLQVGGRPVLETIIQSFMGHGFHNFFLSINYMGEVIENFFGDGSRLGVDIRYLRETNPLGTAGALSLLPEQPEKSILVMNGDLLTNVNFGQLVDFHEDGGFQSTMCVREYRFQVPYGVVQVEGNQVASIVEKPVNSYFVNAGIYALRPETIGMIPKNTRYDITSLLGELEGQEKGIGAFPVHEYWLDIGQHEDFERACNEFGQFFGDDS